MKQLRSWYSRAVSPVSPETRVTPLRMSDFGPRLCRKNRMPLAEARGGLPELQGVSFFRTEIAGLDCRMAVVAPSEEEALTVIERSSTLIESELSHPRH